MNEKIVAIQKILGVTPDGVFGLKSRAALDALLYVTHAVGKASSFADPQDVARFLRCKAQGKSNQECFKVGDNGIGYWDDSTVEGTGPSCAVSPEDMRTKWGSVAAARHKQIEVFANDKSVMCVLKDVMPAERNKANPAIIDLNPDAVRALGLTPPILIDCHWRWA